MFLPAHALQGALPLPLRVGLTVYRVAVLHVIFRCVERVGRQALQVAPWILGSGPRMTTAESDGILQEPLPLAEMHDGTGRLPTTDRRMRQKVQETFLQLRRALEHPYPK
ncbi:hypothetical protein C0075_03440 [Rhizobium sp. KAs_5_22]|nr:hypothetical protein C0075_03440 [Rhizobium sp. KAs_5_22]